jgi:CRP/FNR family transcriptional regulator, cyclic AMP receptor protein
MSIDGGDARTRAASQWARRPTPARRPNSSRRLFAYLLDLDDELAQEFEVRMRFPARQDATARLLDVDAGECDLSPWFELVGRGPGLLIIEGLVAVHTRIADRTVTELLGDGDLLQPPAPQDDWMVDRETAWHALRPTRLALLDTEFAERIRPWPQILHSLFCRAERRSADLEMLRAISCQPRLEARLALLLWHLAARWGRVEPSGLRLTLPLTHRLLGQLLSAERPSVSRTLRRLSEAGIVTGTAGDWHLHGSVETHLESLTERTAHVTSDGEDALRSRERIARSRQRIA